MRCCYCICFRPYSVVDTPAHALFGVVTSCFAAVLEMERNDGSGFQPLPFHYQEIAHCLFTAGTQEALPKEVFGDEQGRVCAPFQTSSNSSRIA